MELVEVLAFFSALGIESLKGRVIGLIGDLGSGKTHLVKMLAEQLVTGLGEQVTSPTYNLCNIYQSSQLVIHHFDLYRTETETDLYDIGLFETIEDKALLVFIEWIDMFPSLTSNCDLIVTITSDTQNHRAYQLSNNQF